MPYYMGDYYQGGLLDVFKGVVGQVVGAVTNPIGTLVGDVKKVLSPNKLVASSAPAIAPPAANLPVPTKPSAGSASYNAPLVSMAGMGGIDVSRGTPGAIPTPGFGGAVSRFLPGGMSGYEMAPRGYHVNKALMEWYKRGGQGKMPHVVNAIVRNRSMNPLNPRALRRANARQHGAVRLMRSVLHGSGWTIKRHGIGAKTRRRSR